MAAHPISLSAQAASRIELNQRVLGISPLEVPDARLVLALCRAGALGVLDLGRDTAAAARALAHVARDVSGSFGVRVPEGATIAPASLPSEARVVVVSAGAAIGCFRPRTVLVQVTSIEEARAAQDAGADGVIAKGCESGGRVGEETSLVLLQRMAREITLPIWVQGGIGVHTAAACVAGGAAGVVLDGQLALVRESSLPDPVKAALRRMDGSETVLVGGHRLFCRPDLPIARLAPSFDVTSVLERLGGTDIERCFLPAGQDTTLARPLAERYRTAGGVVHAIRTSIERHLHDARALRPLAEGAPLAVQHGVRYPIVQGPMTRVSDRAAFADAVSRAGGLPFLALSLLRGDEVRELLIETRALLGDRPFGVGILGFVPEELREEQLAVLRDLRPPAAIIAGGRPSQARPLEALGTLTYLHVPSPGLLDLFLKDGVRRFIFEGHESGGHVGPRTSFVLWELQIERLLAFEAPEALSVLFAGGVHDARSAAMVAAMAAPLAARGAKVGVLMGTAYLFTHEAVTSGAILPGFQRAALECDRTALLETAPGHATRCADTDFVRAFYDEKRRIEREQETPEAIWAALERLNVGRLRLAAKGLRREGGALVPKSPATQRRDGMYMLGQVAALRRETCTIAELHGDVSEGSVRWIEAITPAEPADAPSLAPPAPADVAIIGVGCIFPDAPDRHAYWANILTGRSSITEVPKERWDVEKYFDRSASGGEKTCSKWGGFLPAIPLDPLGYGIPPRSIAAIEPVQLLSLEVACRALEDAGYGSGPGGAMSFDRERTSVIFGAESGSELYMAYGFRALWPTYAGPLPAALGDHLPALTEDSFPGVLVNVIAGRIANRLDLGGVSCTVDAACASSLAAVDLAVKELTSGASELVLCGGADLHNGVYDYLLFSSVRALSPTGSCRAFDASADGTVLGEGVACVVLKRLADAERDGDRIYAVIKGIAGSSDGRSLGLTAPRKEGQLRALERAYRAARVSPGEVGLVEAHGTGTVVGDRTELEALTEVYQRAGAERGAVALGSVKSQIGHTKCAAGIAGLIKAALALHHRALPPALHVERPNASYDPASSPFTFSEVARPWPAERRRAAVSAFGFGGANFHAVLAAHDGDEAPASGIGVWPAELFLFRASERGGAVRQMERLASALDVGELPATSPVRLADLARTVCGRPSDGPVEVAIVASSLGDLRDKLRRAGALDRSAPGVFYKAPQGGAGPCGKVAFLFPGQGSQRAGMLGDLFLAFPRLQRFLALDPRWARLMFPPPATTPEERAAQASALTETRAAQPALGIAALALGELLEACRVRADVVGGHSYGELAALCHAGAIRKEDLLPISEARGECLLASTGRDPGTMAAASASPAVLAPLLEAIEGVVIANHNAPEQTVLAGTTAGMAEALQRLGAAGIAARSIPVACAFHSPIVAGAPERFAERLAAVTLAAPALPVFSNATAAPYPDDPEAVRRMLAEHAALPVRFVDEIEAMYAAGARTFVEVGPGRVLTGLVGKILAGREHVAVACDERGEPGLKQLLCALAELAAAGVPVDPAPLFAGREARVLDLECMPSLRPSDAAWLVDGYRARPVAGELPKGALRPTPEPVIATAAPSVAGDREAVVLEYLRTTREIIAAERQVMLGFLGSGAVGALDPAHAAPGTARPCASEAPREGRTRSPDPCGPRDPSAGSSAGRDAPRPSAKDTLLRITSERTGYPIEMLDLDLNIEADLGIDSIKRVEILGTLCAELGVSGGVDASRDPLLEQLATMKTLRAIVERIEASAAPGGARAGSEAKASGPRETVAARPEVRGAPLGVRRYVLSTEEAPLHGVAAAPLDGRIVAIAGEGGGIARELARIVRAQGGEARLLGAHGVVEAAHVLVDLGGFGASDPVAPLKELFERARRGALSGVATLLAITELGAPFGREGERPRPGFAGLLRSIAKEVPGLCVRVVGLDPHEPASRLAEAVCAELRARDGHVEVAYVGGVRRALVAVDEARDPASAGPSVHVARDSASAGPSVHVARDSASAGPSVHERPTLVPGRGMEPLDQSSVVLITGGARGITAAVTCALAERFRPRFELVGRSPLPEEEEAPAFAAAFDRPSLRRAILARGAAEAPAAIEALCSTILAAREIRSTMRRVAGAGATARYHALDVGDTAAFGALIDRLYAEHGRIDGVVHGAGILEDARLSQKTRASFDRVFDTKVLSALTLAERLRQDVGFVVFFASVAGAFGNRGQVDYAAANDALDKIAWWMKGRSAGTVIAVDWGPWASRGMVSPELAREYARRGIGLIEPEDGLACLFGELSGGGSHAQVILANAPLDALTGAAAERGPAHGDAGPRPVLPLARSAVHA